MSNSPIFDALDAEQNYTDRMAAVKKSLIRYSPLYSSVVPVIASDKEILGHTMYNPDPYLDGPIELVGAQEFEGDESEDSDEEIVIAPFIPAQGLPRGILTVGEVADAVNSAYPSQESVPDTFSTELPLWGEGDPLVYADSEEPEIPLDSVLTDVRETFRKEYPGHVMTAVKAIQHHEDGSATLTVEGKALIPVQPLSEKNSA